MENLQHQFNRYFVDNGATEWWLTGLKTTLLVTVIALCIGVVLGLLIALIRSTHEQTGKLKLLNIVARVYLTIIRGTPSMIQILFSIPLFCNRKPEQYRDRRNCLWYQLRCVRCRDFPFRNHVCG